MAESKPLASHSRTKDHPLSLSSEPGDLVVGMEDQMKIRVHYQHALSVVGGMIVIGLAVVAIGGMVILASRGIKRIPERKLPPEDESDCTNTLAQLQAIYGTNISVSFVSIGFDDPQGVLSTNIQDYFVESSTDLVHWVVEPDMTSLEGVSVVASNRMLPQQFFRMGVR